MKSVRDFKKMKVDGRKISLVTCYDFTSARIVNDSSIDAILVGDSAANVMHGYETTINATLEMMEFHVRAVRRGAPNKFLIADMPFLAHRKGIQEAMYAVDILMKAGAEVVKIEGAGDNLEIITHIVNSGVPVMGHLGLTPQSIHQLGGYKVQGKEEEAAKKLLQEAEALEKAGIFSLVLELVSATLAERVTKTLSVPTIGIGAGSKTSGQVLVWHDLLGMNKGFNPKFLRKYLNGYKLIREALNQYDTDIKNKKFPSKEESF